MGEPTKIGVSLSVARLKGRGDKRKEETKVCVCVCDVFFQASTDLLLLMVDCSMAKGDELLNRVKAKQLTDWMQVLMGGEGKKEERV